MKSRTVGWIVLLDLILVVIWLVVIMALNITRGPIETFEQALEFATEQHWLFYTVTYVNAILLTLSNVAVNAGLYSLLRTNYPVWAAIGLVFVPIYGLIALFSYLSQIVIVPRLLELHTVPEYQATAAVMLRQLVQIWPESSLQYIDQFSYAIGSIPSMIFGVGLFTYSKQLRTGGVLLTLSGATGPIIGIGVLGGFTQLVSAASMLGGVLAIVASACLAVGLLRDPASRAKFQPVRTAG